MTVNGTTVPQFFIGNVGNVPAVSVGGSVAMHFTYQDMNVSSTLTMPGAPTGVTQGANQSVGSPIVINWTAPVSGATNYADIVPNNTVSGKQFSATVSSGVTTYAIPGGTLLNSGTVNVLVEALNETTSLGSSVSAGSIYAVGNQASFNVTTAP